MPRKILSLCTTILHLSSILVWLAACESTPLLTPEVEAPNSTNTLNPTKAREATDVPKSTNTKQPVDIPSLTSTPKPTITPTPTMMIFDPVEISIGVVLPMFPGIFTPLPLPCESSKSQAINLGLPSVIYEFNNRLCIFGFPPNETFNLKIYNPSGDLVDFLRLPSQTIGIGSGGTSFSTIPFLLELDLQTGVWRVVAESGSLFTEISIPFGTDNKPILSNSHLLSPPAISPTDPRRRMTYVPGDTLVVQGINFPPETDIPIGIFLRSTYNKLVPKQDVVLRTTFDGAFNAQFKLDETILNRGAYIVVAFQNPNQPDNLQRQIFKGFTISAANFSAEWMFLNNPMAFGDDMQPNEVLYPGHAISSENGSYIFVYQNDGNLVLYQTESQTPLWSSNTVGSQAGVMIMQADGNLVIYDPNSIPIWASNTCCESDNWLLVQNDGNVVIYRPDNSPIWSTGTVQP